MQKADSFKYFIISVIILIIIAIVIVSNDNSNKVSKHKHDPELIAKVGPNDIRTEQFTREMLRQRNYNQNIDKNALLEEMIIYEALVAKAVEAGLDKNPEVIRFYRNFLVGKFKTANLKPIIDNVDVPDEDVKSYYEANVHDYTLPAKIRLAVLNIKTNQKMSPAKLAELKGRMEQAREKALNTPDAKGFGKLAVEYSEDQVSRYKGGDIGWINQGKDYSWDKNLINAGFALKKPGDISEIIFSDTGIYLVKLMDNREQAVKPLAKIKDRIRHKLLLEKRRQAENKFYQEIRKSLPVEIFSNVLDKVALPDYSEQTDGPPKFP